MNALLDRASGALHGLAIGDALGMPTQLMSRADVVARYGARLEPLEPGDAGHPIAAGLAAGTVTDDTEQAVLLGELLVAGGGLLDLTTWARAPQDWEADMVRRGSADLLGPSTRRALRAVAIPVGDGQLDQLVSAVVAVSRVTHGTDVGLAGAAAVAAAVSAGVSGAAVAAACEVGIAAAPRAAARGLATAAPPLDTLLVRARDLVREFVGAPDGAAEVIETVIGTGLATVESVPAAFAVLAVHPDDPWAACRLAASLGGDSDTIATVVGAIAGACHGASRFPLAARELVVGVNRLRLEELAVGLLDLRRTSQARQGQEAP